MGSSASRQAPAPAEPEPEPEPTSPQQTEDSAITSPEEATPVPSQPPPKAKQRRSSLPQKTKIKVSPKLKTTKAVKKRKQENELPEIAVEPDVETMDGTTESKTPKKWTHTPSKKKAVAASATVTVKKEEQQPMKPDRTLSVAEPKKSPLSTKRPRTKYVKPHRKEKSPPESSPVKASDGHISPATPLLQKRSKRSLAKKSTKEAATKAAASPLTAAVSPLVSVGPSHPIGTVRIQQVDAGIATNHAPPITPVSDHYNPTIRPVRRAPRKPSPVVPSPPFAPPQFVPQHVVPSQPQLPPPPHPTPGPPFPAATAHVSPLISTLPITDQISVSPNKRRRALFENPVPKAPPKPEDQPYFVTKSPVPVVAGHSSLHVNGQSILSDPPPAIIVNDANIPEGHGYEYNFTCRCGHRFATKGNINRHLKTLRYDEEHMKYVHPESEVFIHIFPRVRLKKTEYEAIKAKKQAEVEATAVLAAMRKDRIEESVTVKQLSEEAEQRPTNKRKYADFVGDMASSASTKRKKSRVAVGNMNV
ncbi:uncharacterized protein V1513DRAFT_456990 [Lipomyces chichibuensis]|uniref:uncharacterized protein n=1 Tax=Lipomyces chichibuensis TaxID=1546026 RepID=UPI003344334C